MRYNSLEELKGLVGDGARKKNPALFGAAPAEASTEVRRTSEPNPTEREAAAIYIEPRRLAGEVRRYRAHAVTLLLADRLRYTPDWVIWLPDGRVEYLEVKGGHVHDDARAKFKMAVEQFPEHTFYWAQKLRIKEGGWKLVKYPARD